jgi:hypothetical protein
MYPLHPSQPDGRPALSAEYLKTSFNTNSTFDKRASIRITPAASQKSVKFFVIDDSSPHCSLPFSFQVTKSQVVSRIQSALAAYPSLWNGLTEDAPTVTTNSRITGALSVLLVTAVIEQSKMIDRCRRLSGKGLKNRVQASELCIAERLSAISRIKITCPYTSSLSKMGICSNGDLAHTGIEIHMEYPKVKARLDALARCAFLLKGTVDEVKREICRLFGLVDSNRIQLMKSANSECQLTATVSKLDSNISTTQCSDDSDSMRALQSCGDGDCLNAYMPDYATFVVDMSEVRSKADTAERFESNSNRNNMQVVTIDLLKFKSEIALLKKLCELLSCPPETVFKNKDVLLTIQRFAADSRQTIPVISLSSGFYVNIKDGRTVHEEVFLDVGGGIDQIKQAIAQSLNLPLAVPLALRRGFSHGSTSMEICCDEDISFLENHCEIEAEYCEMGVHCVQVKRGVDRSSKSRRVEAIAVNSKMSMSSSGLNNSRRVDEVIFKPAGCSHMICAACLSAYLQEQAVERPRLGAVLVSWV